MTIILAIETSTHTCSAALYKDGYIDERYQYAPRLHGELILPMVDSLLSSAQLSLQQVDALAVGCGPGSFTGVRLGVSTIQGLAFGAKKPVIPVSSLLTLADNLYYCLGFTQVACAFDARMNEVYWGSYILVGGEWVATAPECVISPEQVPQLPPNWVGAGDGWGRYPKELTISSKIQEYYPRCYPHAGSVARLAVGYFKDKKVLEAKNTLPTYLRNKVV